MSRESWRALHSLVAKQPCPLGYITADKREIKDFPKSRQVGTSFICKTLYAIGFGTPEMKRYNRRRYNLCKEVKNGRLSSKDVQ